MPTSAFVAPFRFSRPAQLWLMAAFLVHALLGTLVGLSVDEAHYALYAVHLDWSYFDHPPLVGWLQWPLVALGVPEGVLRLVAQVLWLLAVVLVHGLARRLQGGQTPVMHARSDAGAWAVAVMALSPLLHVLGIGLLPDTLLMVLACAVMWVTLELREAAALQRWQLWGALGLLLGLAGLSKYTAILWALAVALCLLYWHGARVLRQSGLWLAVLIAAACIVPVLGWNYRHQWISFAYQLQHGSGGSWQGVHVLRFVVIQLLVYGPLFLAAGLGVRPRATVGVCSLAAFFVLPWGVLAVMAGGGTSLPHWTAPAWVCLAPFAGLGLAAVRTRAGQWLRASLAGLQALACVALLGLMVTAGQPWLNQAQGQGNSAQPSNPFADVHGWDRAGQRAREWAQQEGLTSVSVQNWTLASRLGWYARPLPVHVLEDRFDQFTLWAGPLPAGGATLLVDWSQLGYEVPLGTHGFTHCALRETLPVQRLGATIATFRFYACKGWSGVPRPQLRGAS